MIMPNFMHIFNAYTSQTWINMLCKDITGQIIKDAYGVSNNMAIGLYADAAWKMASTGDFTPENFYNGSMLFVGNGTTAPTEDDYNLESLIEYSAEGLHMESISLAYNENAGHYKTNRIMTVVLKNKSNTNITVSEIGWFLSVPKEYGAEEGSNYFRVMMAREVFEPVTIKQGEVRAFTMSIEM